MYRKLIVYLCVYWIIFSFSCSKPIIDDPDPGDNNSPIAVINSKQTGIIGEFFVFDASDSYDPDEYDTIDKHSWNFGDGNTTEGEIVEHAYDSTGTYTVELIVTDSRGLESEPVYLTVTVESNLPVIDAKGCGVICQSISTKELKEKYTTSGSRKYNWKRVETLSPAKGKQAIPRGFSLSRAVSPQFLMDNNSFFLLDWDPLPGIDYYKIYFIYPGNEEVEIWDSQGIHHGDPLFNQENPQAYLDLSFECFNLVSSPGSYTFSISGYTVDDQLAALSGNLSLSIGQYVSGFPETIIVSVNTMNWTMVPGADGYRIHLYNNNGNKVFYFPLNPGELTSSTLISFPDLTTGEYYYCYIDSAKKDSDGNIIEMTRAVTGFIY